MAITIVFRGVGVYVRSGLTVVELLFPNAEELPPPNNETGDDGLPRHADNTRATNHFAGVLIPGDNGDEYRKLLGRLIVFPGTAPTEIDQDFPTHFPPLREVTNGGQFGLRLLPDAARQTPQGRVATRIKFSGGQLTPAEASGVPFNIDGHHSEGGVAIRQQMYSTGAVWTLDAVDELALDVFEFSDSGPPVRERQIQLKASTSTHASAYFYNFDNGLPTKDDLGKNETTADCKGRLSDHDFKWVYQLMDFANPPFKTWQNWLQGEEFPTPWTPCSGLKVPASDAKSNSQDDILLLPISTCFETVVEE